MAELLVGITSEPDAAKTIQRFVGFVWHSPENHKCITLMLQLIFSRHPYPSKRKK